jgi:DnaJ-class molecular chaperone
MNLKKYIYIGEGETLCKKCKGRGRVPLKDKSDVRVTLECSECLGEGKIDWVEIITKKKRNNQNNIDETPIIWNKI